MAFFQHVLGPRLKHICCYFPESGLTLGEAERRMLALTCRHARLDDGMEVLELGCGWGSLSPWMAGRYPRCRILAVSDLVTQCERHILEACTARRLKNLGGSDRRCAAVCHGPAV